MQVVEQYHHHHHGGGGGGGGGGSILSREGDVKEKSQCDLWLYLEDHHVASSERPPIVMIMVLLYNGLVRGGKGGRSGDGCVSGVVS
jgi:hypothetical protein